MKSRCYSINNTSYENYGGRGIKLCDEWLKGFDFFREWAFKNGYKENLTIDRINSDRNYEPNNCRWSDRHTQCANRRHIENRNGISKISENKYRVRVHKNRKAIFDKCFKTWEEAIEARNNFILENKLPHTLI